MENIFDSGWLVNFQRWSNNYTFLKIWKILRKNFVVKSNFSNISNVQAVLLIYTNENRLRHTQKQPPEVLCKKRCS